jgi:16S rRNA (uracil1498-N3)-methyltransferase
MELFFSRDIDGSVCRLDADESAHCVKVLRHREGDDIHVIDGEGTLYTCRILSASPKEVEAQVTGVERDWGAHPYRLRMAVCPTKNADRYEWFAEKATELGLDVITPVIGDHSERRVFKTDRLKRILLSASKQSLKGAVPQVDEPVPLRDLIESYSNCSCLKLICCCYEGEEKRVAIGEALRKFDEPEYEPGKGWHYGEEKALGTARIPEIVILIGPEGDFSREEVELAIECGFRPVHLGPSRLRTETAALTAVAAVYFHYCGNKGM